MAPGGMTVTPGARSTATDTASARRSSRARAYPLTSSLTCTDAAPTTLRDACDLARPTRRAARPARPQGAERVVEVVERLQQEPGAVGPVVAAAEDGVVEDEQRHHLVRLPGRARERRVVVDAEIAGEHDHRHRRHGRTLPRSQFSNAQVRSAMPGERVQLRALPPPERVPVASDEQRGAVVGE